MNNAPASNPDQLQSAYHQAVELAYLVVDTLSIASLKELWKRSDFSALDKAMLRMLRRGSEKTQERTASKLVEAMHNETKSISPTALVKYNPLVEDPLTPLFQKRLKKMRTLFADPEVREAFFSGFTDRKEHWELLALGKPGAEQVAQLDKQFQELTTQKHTLMLEKFFKGVKMTDIEKSTINEALIEIDDQLSALAQQKYDLLENPATAKQETATVWRLEKLKRMKRKDGYVMTPSRQSIFDNAVEKFLEGNHILLKGDTGSGKTAIAVQIAKYIEELSAGKIKTMQIDGKKLEAEAKDPETLRNIKQMVFSGNPFTTQSDLIGKSKLKGAIEMEFQYSKLLTAFMEGRVLIFDELDSVPGDVLYRIKHLFEQKPMSLYAPQEDGGAWKALLQTKIIATANIHSEDKYRDKEKIPVPVQDNFVGIEVPYMPKDEIYDFALGATMTKEGFIKGVGAAELTANGAIESLIECIDQIEKLFTGQTIGSLSLGTIDNNAEYSLKYAIWTMRSLIPLFREWKGKNLNARIKTEIVDFIAKATDPDDRKVLLKVFAEKGFLGKQDIEPTTAYQHRNGTLSLAQVLHLPESDLQAILVMDVKKFPESAELFLDPYEVARLDPYGKRHLEELALGNPLMKIRHQLGTVYDKLISSTNPKYSAFAQTFSEIVEQAEQAGTFSAQDIEAILGDAYRIYDKKDPLMVEIWQQLSTLDAERREVANKIEKEDNKKMFGKKFGAEVKEQPEISKPTTTPEKMGTLEQQMVNHILATNGKRVTQLKTTGFLDIEEGDKIQTHLTGAEKNELRPLAQSDITEVTPVKKTYQGEKYYIITCKIRGEPYTAIQVPNKLKKTKYQDTHMGRQLMKFKGNDWYPAFLTDEKLEKPLAQDRLIRKTEPAMQADGTPHTNIKLYTDGDPEGDIVRECAKKGMRMLTITDCVIMAELIKGRFGENYLGEEFTESNFGKTKTEASHKDIQKKLKKIEDEFGVKYVVNTKDAQGYLNREYSMYKQQRPRDRITSDGSTVKEYFSGFFPGTFRSGDSVLGGVASVELNWDLVESNSHLGFRPGV